MSKMCGTSYFISKKTFEGNSCVLCMCVFPYIFFQISSSHAYTHRRIYDLVFHVDRNLEKTGEDSTEKRKLFNLCEIKGGRNTNKDLNYNE